MPRNVLEVFRTTAAARPDAVAARYEADGQWREMTWRAMDTSATEAAAALVRAGIAAGERVAILSNTRVEWSVADLGIMGAGAATVPIYQSNLPSECEYILRDAGCVAVFVEDAAQLVKIRQVRQAVPGLRLVVCFTPGAVDPGTPSEVPWDRFLESGREWLGSHRAEVDARGAALDPESPLTIIYTSGTTGPPKGAVLVHDCMLYEAGATREIGVIGPDDVEYLFLPLAHSFAKVLEVAWFATGHVMAFWRRDQKKIVEDLGIVRPTVFAAVPRILEKVHARIVEDVDRRPGLMGALARWGLAKGREAASAAGRGGSSWDPGWLLARTLVFGAIGRQLHERFGGRLRFCVSGGAPLSRELAWFFHFAGVKVCEGYGLTETSAGTTINRPDRIRPGTVGAPLPGTDVRIAPDGEVLVRGRGVMRRYWNREADTAEAIDGAGWFHTGDIGEIDPDGTLRITDRKKDIIVTAGGKNIAPQNIENALKSVSPLVSQVVVHGDMQRYLTALVTLDAETLMAWAAERGMRAAGDYAALTRTPEVRAEIDRAVAEVNRELPSYSTVKRVAILDHDFQVGDQLTPTLKVRRKLCVDRYRSEIEEMYAAAEPPH